MYVKTNEKKEYGKAMNKAIVENNFSDLEQFYYYKICDSIIELDILKRIANNNEMDDKKTL